MTISHVSAWLGAAVMAMGVAAAAAAQSYAPLQPGEILENGGGQQVKVLQCRPVVYGRECETTGWENGRATSNPAWWDERMLVQGDARVRAALGKPPRGGARTTTTTTTAPRPAAPARPASTRATAAPVATTPGTATSTRIPDGTYQCQMWMGSSYVSLGAVRSAGGALTSNPLAKVGATITGVTRSADGITISYTTARGYRESMDCKR